MKEFMVIITMSKKIGDVGESVEYETTIEAESVIHAHQLITEVEWFMMENIFIVTQNGGKKREEKSHEFIAVNKIQSIFIKEINVN